MAEILFVSQGLPWPIEHGGSLRILNLARELSRYHRCKLVAITENSDDLESVKRLSIFSDVMAIDPVKQRSWRRHLRLSDENFFKHSSRIEFEKVTSAINGYIKDNNINIVICMGIFVSEFLDEIKGVKKVIDDCDSRTLAAERNYEVYKKEFGLVEKARYFLDLLRIRNQEKKLSEKFDLITTISPVDLARIGELNDSHTVTPMVVIPNGVSDELVNIKTEYEEMPYTISFWGNLAFPPNRTAIEYFCEEIYLPYLKAEGIVWYVIGKNPGPLLTERAAQFDSIILTGFVEDLFEFAGTIPVMINPMITGSGQKNKVLEAFMLGKGVISTSMGMESFDVKHNEHCLIADDPEAFAQSVMDLLNDNNKRVDLGSAARQLVLDQYTWSKAGAKLNEVIQRLF